MGKVTTFILSPLMTFREKSVKTDENKLKINKEWQPEFTPGISIFSETDLSRIKFWKKPRKMVFVAEGSLHAFEFKPKTEGDEKTKEIFGRFGTIQELRKFVAKILAKSKAEQKPFSNWQVIGLLCGLGLVIVLQVLILRNVGGFRF